MQIETLLTEQKWNILQSLAHEPKSPLQLSELLNTTIANISQQLKLLEAVNLVKKEKVKNRDKGKPRSLFSLSSNHLLLLLATPGFAQKKLVIPSPYQRALVKAWLLGEDVAGLEESLWQLRPHFSSLRALWLDMKTKTLLIRSTEEKLKVPSLTLPHKIITSLSVPSSALLLFSDGLEGAI